MAFPNLSAQQETNRKILEDLQLKRQLLQKGVNTLADINNLSTVITTTASQMPTSQLLAQPADYTLANNTSGSGGPVTVAASRSAFNPNNNSTTLAYFISQDSYYGNSFIPVLPRLDPLNTNHTPSKN